MPKLSEAHNLKPFRTISDVREQPTETWEATDEQQKRKKRVEDRVNDMIKKRHPYEKMMKRSLLEYEGRSRDDPEDERDEVTVAPISYIYVETKTAEEVNATNSYEFVPVESAGDSWKVDLLDQIRKHVEARTNYGETFIEWHRQKNIFGVGIIRTGYRNIQGVIKQRVQDEETGETLDWEEVVVDKYDDLFFDIVSPFNFGIDPNAKRMTDAEDCFVMEKINWNDFQERYATSPLYSETEFVVPGKFAEIGENSQVAEDMDDDMVLIYEYFNRITDEWITYANGVEIRVSPLPDDHKMLPFASIHNNSSFITDMVGSSYAKTSTGQDASTDVAINGEESFWTKSDSERIRDLTRLRTDFGRAAFRSAKLAGESIVATAPGKKFNPNKKWRSGDQAVGMMNQFQVAQLGTANAGNFEFMFDVLDQLITLTVGIDPRVMSDPKQKTAEEAAIQRETGMVRIKMGIKKNQAGGISRLGKMTAKNSQQYYSIPKIQVLTGNEDVSKFDIVEKRSDGTKVGKTFRRVTTDEKFIEEEENGEKVLRRDKDGTKGGVNSFVAKPGYIRTSEVDIRVLGTIEAGEIKAMSRHQLLEAIRAAGEMLPWVQVGVLKAEDIGNVKELWRRLMETFNVPSAIALGNKEEGVDAVPKEDQMMQEFLGNRNQFAKDPDDQMV